jgi:hypothetical protein
MDLASIRNTLVFSEIADRQIDEPQPHVIENVNQRGIWEGIQLAWDGFHKFLTLGNDYDSGSEALGTASPR